MERFPSLDVRDAIVEGSRGGGGRGGHIGVLDVWVVGWWCGVDHGIVRAVQRVCSTHPTRTLNTMRIPPLLSLFVLSASVIADQAALYPPGLQPIIHRANTLLSLGQFSDAAKAYSEAIGCVLSAIVMIIVIR